jgi:sugar phosphate isomerase/epimerase
MPRTLPGLVTGDPWQAFLAELHRRHSPTWQRFKHAARGASLEGNTLTVTPYGDRGARSTLRADWQRAQEAAEGLGLELRLIGGTAANKEKP